MYTRSVLAHVDSLSLLTREKFCGRFAKFMLGSGRVASWKTTEELDDSFFSPPPWELMELLAGDFWLPEGDFWEDPLLSRSPSPFVEPVLPSSSLSVPCDM